MILSEIFLFILLNCDFWIYILIIIECKTFSYDFETF